MAGAAAVDGRRQLGRRWRRRFSAQAAAAVAVAVVAVAVAMVAPVAESSAEVAAAVWAQRALLDCHRRCHFAG